MCLSNIAEPPLVASDALQSAGQQWDPERTIQVKDYHLCFAFPFVEDIRLKDDFRFRRKGAGIWLSLTSREAGTSLSLPTIMLLRFSFAPKMAVIIHRREAGRRGTLQAHSFLRLNYIALSCRGTWSFKEYVAGWQERCSKRDKKRKKNVGKETVGAPLFCFCKERCHLPPLRFCKHLGIITVLTHVTEHIKHRRQFEQAPRKAYIK